MRLIWNLFIFTFGSVHHWQWYVKRSTTPIAIHSHTSQAYAFVSFFPSSLRLHCSYVSTKTKCTTTVWAIDSNGAVKKLCEITAQTSYAYIHACKQAMLIAHTVDETRCSEGALLMTDAHQQSKRNKTHTHFVCQWEIGRAKIIERNIMKWSEQTTKQPRRMRNAKIPNNANKQKRNTYCLIGSLLSRLYQCHGIRSFGWMIFFCRRRRRLKRVWWLNTASRIHSSTLKNEFIHDPGVFRMSHRMNNFSTIDCKRHIEMENVLDCTSREFSRTLIMQIASLKPMKPANA